jgi:hypothetical protein
LVLNGSNTLVKQLSGGVNSDSSFDIGGAGFSFGVEVTERVRGSITSSGDVTGSAKARGQGTVQGTSVSVNCIATYEVTAHRLP